MQLVVLVAAAVPATIELLEPINKALVQREATDRTSALTGQMHSSVLIGREGQKLFTHRWDRQQCTSVVCTGLCRQLAGTMVLWVVAFQGPLRARVPQSSR